MNHEKLYLTGEDAIAHAANTTTTKLWERATPPAPDREVTLADAQAIARAEPDRIRCEVTGTGVSEELARVLGDGLASADRFDGVHVHVRLNSSVAPGKYRAADLVRALVKLRAGESMRAALEAAAVV